MTEGKKNICHKHKKFNSKAVRAKNVDIPLYPSIVLYKNETSKKNAEIWCCCWPNKEEERGKYDERCDDVVSALSFKLVLVSGGFFAVWP